MRDLPKLAGGPYVPCKVAAGRQEEPWMCAWANWWPSCSRSLLW